MPKQRTKIQTTYIFLFIYIQRSSQKTLYVKILTNDYYHQEHTFAISTNICVLVPKFYIFSDSLHLDVEDLCDLKRCYDLYTSDLNLCPICGPLGFKHPIAHNN